MLKAKDIHSYILSFAVKHNSPLTNLQAQYILYLIFVKYFHMYRKPLWNMAYWKEQFAAWEKGPVIVELYFAYQGTPFIPITDIKNEISKPDDIPHREFIDGLLQNLITLGTHKLSNMCCEEISYKIAKAKGKGTHIDFNDIEKYYDNTVKPLKGC